MIDPSASIPIVEQTPHARIAAMCGQWAGPARTWFEPEVLGDESEWRGTIHLALDGRFAIHEYEGTLGGAPQQGMMTIGYNRQRLRYEAAWIDSQHNGSALMYCVGTGGPEIMSVLGSYADPGGGPDWGWRTAFEMPDADSLVITAYNITPAGEEAKAIETVYRRV